MRRAEAPRQATWDRYWAARAAVQEVYPAVSDLLAEIRRVFPQVDGLRILEVGAGTGREAHTLAMQGASVWVLDFSPEALRLSRQLSRGPKFARADALRLPFPDESFDLVYHQGLLEHYSDPMPLLRENRRVLKPVGVVLVDVPQKFHAYTLIKKFLIALNRWFAGWETQFSPREIERIVERAGFQPIYRYGYGMRPGLTYRMLREGVLKLGIRLPMYPRFGFLRPVEEAWHRIRRRLEQTRLGPYITLTVGVVARRTGGSRV